MEQEEKLKTLLDKLRRNKEKVPLEILKTRYKDACEKLLAEISAEAVKLIQPVAAELPGWLDGRKVRQEYIGEIESAFNRIYKDGGYAKKIGTALYRHYSLDEARKLSGEINRLFRIELQKLFHQKTCLYTTAENWDPENPVPPRIYNDLVDRFWDGENCRWVTEDKPQGAALLIFSTGDRPGEQVV